MNYKKLIILVLFIAGCAVPSSTYTAKPSEVFENADFYEKFNDGVAVMGAIETTVFRFDESQRWDDLYIWIINSGTEPIKLNYLTDEVKGHKKEGTYILKIETPINKYPRHINPGSYAVIHVDIPRGVLPHSFSEISFRIGLTGKVYKVPHVVK